VRSRFLGLRRACRDARPRFRPSAGRPTAVRVEIPEIALRDHVSLVCGELRKKWPLAFPVRDQDVRPLAIGAADEIAVVQGWSLPYTLGVLSRWKMLPVYCNAILCYNQRIALDGSPAEMVEAKAKDLATKHLARLAAGTAAEKAAKTGAPAVVKPKPASAPPAKQLRDLVRASHLRRRA
jgi:sRNA-binding protein